MVEIQKYLEQIIDIDSKVKSNYDDLKKQIAQMEAENREKLQGEESTAFNNERTSLKEIYDEDLKVAKDKSKEILEEASKALNVKRDHYYKLKKDLVKQLTGELLNEGKVNA